MWSLPRHEVLKLLSEDASSLFAAEIAEQLRRSNDRTFRKWLANLQMLGLIQYEPSGRIVATPSGQRIGSALYVNVIYLRTVWCVAEIGSPATLDQIRHKAGGDLNPKYLQDAARAGHVSKKFAYSGLKYRNTYRLKYLGAELLVTYAPLGELFRC